MLRLWPLLAIFCSVAYADLVPFYTFELSPLTSIHGAPPLGEAKLLRPGRTRLHIVSDVTSHFVSLRKNTEILVLDMESYRSGLLIRHGVNRFVEVGVDLPYTSQSRGLFDEAIDWWHGVFDFADGGRDQAPKRRFLLLYNRNGQDLIHMVKPQAGWSDVRFSAALQLWHRAGLPRSSVALRAGFKLDSAESKSLLGSGGRDYALALHVQHTRPTQRLPMAWWGHAGVFRLGESQFLAFMQRRHAVFGSAGIGGYVTPKIILKTQIDMHSAYYRNSLLEQLDGTAGQITVGATFRIRRNLRLDVGLVEDILVHSVPDVSLHMRLSGNL